MYGKRRVNTNTLKIYTYIRYERKKERKAEERETRRVCSAGVERERQGARTGSEHDRSRGTRQGERERQGSRP